MHDEVLTQSAAALLPSLVRFTYCKRLSFKDYVDWYFMLKEKQVALSDVIALAQEKFGTDFNDRLFLGQLVSVSDIPSQAIDFLRGAVDKTEIAEFLERTVKTFAL